MHAFDRQTDRQTDGRTDGQKSHRKTALHSMQCGKNRIRQHYSHKRFTNIIRLVYMENNMGKEIGNLQMICAKMEKDPECVVCGVLLEAWTPLGIKGKKEDEEEE